MAILAHEAWLLTSHQELVFSARILPHNHSEAGVKVKPKAKEKHTGGKKALLSKAQLEKLTQALQEKPSDGGISTGVKVARWIEKETGRKKVWNQRGWDYLKQCSY